MCRTTLIFLNSSFYKKLYCYYILLSFTRQYTSFYTYVWKTQETISLYAGPKRALVFTWFCWSVHTLEQYGLRSPYCCLHNFIHTPALNPAPDEDKHPFTVSRPSAMHWLNFCMISSEPGSVAWVVTILGK